MANNGYLFGPPSFDLRTVENVCRQAVQDAGVGDQVDIIVYDNYLQVGVHGMGYLGISIQENTKGLLGVIPTDVALSIRHGHRGEWMWWLDTYITNILAHQLNCRITDEGVGEVWDADISKYPTYRDWIEKSYGLLSLE